MNTDFNEDTKKSDRTVAEPVRWLQFLPRWSLMLGLATLALPIVFFSGGGSAGLDVALGADDMELLQAVRSLTMFRTLYALDSVI